MNTRHLTHDTEYIRDAVNDAVPEEEAEPTLEDDVAQVTVVWGKNGTTGDKAGTITRDRWVLDMAKDTIVRNSRLLLHAVRLSADKQRTPFGVLKKRLAKKCRHDTTRHHTTPTLNHHEQSFRIFLASPKERKHRICLEKKSSARGSDRSHEQKKKLAPAWPPPR